MCDRIADRLVSLQTRRQRVRASKHVDSATKINSYCDLLPRVPHQAVRALELANGFVSGFHEQPGLLA